MTKKLSRRNRQTPFGPGPWAEHSLCSQHPSNLWLDGPKTPQQEAYLKGICSRCPVYDQCLEWALKNDELVRRDCVWCFVAGKTAKERKSIILEKQVETLGEEND